MCPYICVLILLYICSVERVPKEGAPDVCGSCCTGLAVASDIFSFSSFFSCSLEQLVFLKKVLQRCAAVAGVGWRSRLSYVVHPQTEERRNTTLNPKP